MKTLTVTINENKIIVNTDQQGSGEIVESTLPKECCPSCNQENCCFTCDGSQGADENNTENEEQVRSRIQWNAAMDTIESLVLSHACQGINVEDPKYAQGIEDTLDALVNNLGD